jgi:2-oxoglutarate dehydrogenase E1 component
MNHLDEQQKAQLEIKNSNLSEFGVLGFEYGYSFTNPSSLTIWEAQFGDFANGAQVVIDQYITSGEAKWLRMNGLVMLLPHGYEGQGPEHSSARLERFLQLCARDNMQVANPTTPASLFHILRRQMHRNFRKPLIIMSPKSLLRHKLAISDLSEFVEGTKFQLVLPETDRTIDPKGVTRLIFCTGKVYYDLYERRQELKRNDVAIVRLEQIYPFPKLSIADELKKYPNAEVVWCQEEHENMGAYYFVDPRLERVLAAVGHKHKRAKYVGRNRSASPAVGYMKLHVIELAKLLEDAFAK